MSVVDISRWQFGITTVYHFILVPLTIGLAPLIAIMQTVWHRTGNEQWLKATKFFGKLFVINFALGVATGIVQEFQFGMNWSEYSRYVADVFGAPLAMEGLVAFFVESTFIGLWMFGWGRLNRRLHLACIWLVAFGVNASAYFIIAANSWMQHPVGVEWSEERGRPAMNNFLAVITNNTTLVAFPHVIVGALLTAATFVAIIGLWWMARNGYRAHMIEKAALGGSESVDAASAIPDTTAPSQVGASPDKLREDNKTLWRPVTVFALWVVVASGIGLAITGDMQAQIMFKQQPMKMAAAESLCETETGASFSILSIGRQNNCDNIEHVVQVPNMLSFLADHRFDSEVKGVNELQKQYQEALNMPGQNFAPNLFVTYWSFRAMITWALGSVVVALGGLWFLRRKRSEVPRWFGRVALWMLPTPFVANASGWIFTEMGRQPWVVVPNWADADGNPTQIHMLVQDGVSNHTGGMVMTTLIGFTLLYGALGVVWFYLERKYVREGPSDKDAVAPDVGSDDDEDAELSFAY